MQITAFYLVSNLPNENILQINNIIIESVNDIEKPPVATLN